MLSAEFVQLICNCVVLGIGVFVLLSALFGLKKGLLKSAAGLISWAIVFAIVYGFNMKFVDLYFNLDLSIILSNFGDVSFDVNGTQVSMMQSFGEFIEDLLTSFGMASASGAATALAKSILGLVVIILHLLLSFLIIAPLLKFIIYRLILKPIFGRILRNRKLRLAGFFANGVKTALVWVMMLTPLLNIVENLMHGIDEGLAEDYQYQEENSNDAWKVIYPVAQGYNGSFLHTIFGAITGSGTNNGYYTATVEGTNTNVNFVEIVDGFASVAVAVFSTAKDVSEASLTTAILADHTLGVFADQVLSSAFLMGEVLPVALTIGVEMLTSMEDSIIDKETGDMIAAEIGDIDFSADLTSYINLFRVLNREGLITNVIEESGAFDYELSRENQVLLDDALSQFRNDQEAIKSDNTKTTILDVVLPPVLASLVRNSTTEELPLDQMLPTTAEGFRSLNVIDILQVASDVLFNVNDLYKNAVRIDPSLGVHNRSYVKKQNDEVADLSFMTLANLMENNALVKTLLGRDNIFDGTIDSRDETSTRKITTLDLFAGNELDKGLFDITFLIETFPGVIDYALGSLTSDENASFAIAPEVIDEINETLSHYDTKQDWVDEIGALLHCVGTIFDNDDLPVMKLSSDGQIITEEIDIANPATQGVIKELCGYVDESEIIVNVFPAILKSSLDISTIPLLADYGVTMDDFNFDNFTTGSTLGSEVCDLIDAFAIIMDMNFEENFLTSDSIDSDELFHAFEYMLDCEIINPEALPNESHENNILRKVILGLMNSNDMQEIGLSLDHDLYDEKLENGGLLDELRNICDILDVIKESDGLSSLLEANGNASITDLSGKDIEDLVEALSASDFLRPCLSTVIEKQLSPVFDDMGINSSYLNFDSMENASKEVWADEGKKLGVIVDELKVITNNDVENVDWISLVSDPTVRENLEHLFVSLQSLNFLDGEYVESNIKYDRFGLVVYSLLESSLTDFIKDDNKEQIKKDFSFVYYREDYFKNISDESNIINSDLSRNELWEIEINKLLDVFSNIEPLLVDEGGSKVLNITTIDASNIDSIIALIVGEEVSGGTRVAGFNDLTIFRTLLSSILTNTLGDGSSLNFEGFDMSDAYIHTDIFTPGFALNLETGSEFKEFALDNSDLYADVNATSYREAETLLRRKEISNLLGVTKDILNLGEFSIDNISAWVNDNVIGDLLSSLHDSLIMHTPSVALSKGKLTAFEKVIDVVLDSSVSSMIYDSREDHVKVIQKITFSEMNNGSISWDDPSDGEIAKLSSALQEINNLKTATGEDTPLKKFILGAEDAPSAIDLTTVNEDVNNREIEIIIVSLADSNLFNPGADIDAKYANNSPLGKLFDDNMGESLANIGMENHSFRKTDLFDNDWHEEAEKLSALINEVKAITDNGDGTYKDMTEIDYSDYDSLEGLINAMYDIPSINAVYDETKHASSFGDFVYYAISSSYLTNTSVSNEEKDAVKVDIYEVESNGNLDTWKDNGSTKGEITKLIDLMRISGEEGYGVLLDGQVKNENFTSVYKGVNGDNGNTLPGVAMLRDMNEITFLRTVLSSLIRTELSSVQFDLGNFDTSKIYAPLFSDVINKDVDSSLTRETEKANRKAELDNLVSIVEYTIDLDGLLDGSAEFAEIETNIDSVIDMLDVMADSSFFHNHLYGVDRSCNETSFFEDVMLEVLKNSASEFIYDNNEADMKEVIVAISDGNNSLSWNKDSNGELYRLKDAIDTISLLKDSNGDDTELRKLILGTGGSTISITEINNNDYEGHKNNEIELLLKAFSSSNLLNPSSDVASKYASNSLLGKAFDENVGTSLSDLGMYNHSFAKVDRFDNDWNVEAETLSALVNEVKVVTDNGDGTYKDMTEIDYSDSSSLEGLINAMYDIPSINAVYDETKHASSFADFVYHAISDSYLTNTSVSDEEKAKVKEDIYEVESDGNLDTWKDNGSIKGEISKLIDLMDISGENGYGVLLDGQVKNENFTKVYKGVNGDNGNTLPGVAMLRDMNEITFLRTVLSSLVRTELSSVQFDLGNFDTSKIYAPLFSDVINKDVDSSLTRETEKANRKAELDDLVEIVEYSNELNGLLDGSAEFAEIETNIDSVIDMLDVMADSSFFHNHLYGVDRSSNETSFFEDVMLEVLKNSASEFIYEDDENEMKEVIVAITDNSSLSWNEDSNGELYRLKDAIDTISLLKDSSGNDTELRKLILGTGGSTISITKLNNNDYAGQKDNEIELLLKAFSSSNLLNPSSDVASKYETNSLLGKAFDAKVGTSLSDLGMENHSFAKVDRFNNDWNTEASSLSTVVNELKVVDTTGNLADIEWADVEAETLKELFVSVYKVPSINATYGMSNVDYNGATYEMTSYEDLIEHVIEVSFNADTTGDGVGDTFTSADLDNIYFDVYSVGNDYVWYTENELNGLPETNPGQTDRFITLLDDASAEGYGIIIGGKFVVDNFTTYSDKKGGYGVEILYSLNDVYFLRTVFGALLENTFASSSGFAVGGLSKDKIYLELFNDVINYKVVGNSVGATNRELEYSKRAEEIAHLVDVVEYSEEINDILSDASSSLSSFEDQDIVTAFDLLRSLEDSRLFHVGRYKESGTYNTTFFEDAVMLVFDNANVDDLIYDSVRDAAYGSKKAKLASYVKDISLKNVFEKDLNANNVFDANEYRSWDDELNSLQTSFINIKNIDGLINASGEIVVSELDTAKCQTAMTNLNSSFLTRDTLGNTMKTIYEEIGLDAYQIDVNETDKAPDYYLDNITSIDNISSKAKWDTEIENICDTKDVFGDSITDFDFAKENQNIAGILDVTSKSNIMEPMFEDFIYNIFKDAGLDKYISSIAISGAYAEYTNTYVGDANATAKTRRDTLEFLSNEKVTSWYFEGQVLDDMIHQMEDLLGLDLNEVSESVATSVNNLFASVFDYSGADYDYAKAVDSTENIIARADMVVESNYSRGYLASELMLNYLDEKLNNGNLHVTYFEDIRYDYSYVCFNDYEREALEYMILMANEFNSHTTILSLISSFDATYSKHMGPGTAIDSEKRDTAKILLADGWNSNIALQMLESNYLEEIINDRFSISISNVFTAHNKPIEYAAQNEWGTNLYNAVMGI